MRVAAIVLAMVLFTSCAMLPQHSVSIGLTHISYVKKGSRTPVIILEAGMGDGLSTWKPVFDELSQTAMTMAYSRPGYAGGAFWRRQADGKRTADDVVQMLKRILDETGASPPYILVGHSIGGTYMLRFARLYPEEVAGIVLIDARLKGFAEKCEASGLNLCRPHWAVSLLLPDHVREELAGLEETEAQAPGPDELGDIPVTVIAATEPPVYASKDLQRLWLRCQREFADELAKGRYVEADGAGHYVHRDNPDLVIREICSLVEQVRSTKVVAGD